MTGPGCCKWHFLILSNISTKSTSLKLSSACLQVLGERELLRQEVQKELAAAADAELGPKFLHIVVKLADIESVYFKTASGRSLKFDQSTEQRPRSALTAALAESPRKEDAPLANNRSACPSMHAGLPNKMQNI